MEVQEKLKFNTTYYCFHKSGLEIFVNDIFDTSNGLGTSHATGSMQSTQNCD